MAGIKRGLSLAVSLLAALGSSAPADPRDGISDSDTLHSLLAPLQPNAAASPASGASAIASWSSVFNNILPTATPDSVSAAVSAASAAYASATPDDLAGIAVNLKLAGFPVPSTPSNTTVPATPASRQPATPIYPQKAAGDAPYDVPEATLQSAINIPSNFTYGRGSKKPVILIPGTGAEAGSTFANTYVPLLSQTSYADPVWVEIPAASLGDVQTNAEYVAYAIGYVSSISQNSNVSIISWSQGSIDTQWALQYWPSTRPLLEDFIPLSPDFAGTIESYLTCPFLSFIGCTPSVFQQAYNSTFITTLRAGGGSSAYVPTTTVYSSTDEIVEPQQGTGASGFLRDARGVGVSNTDVQLVCPNATAQNIVLHEGILYNAVAYALAVDALTHDGPGEISRLDLGTVCGESFAPGLNTGDVLATEALLIQAAFNVLTYPDKVNVEPAIKPYALTSSRRRR